MNEHALVVLAMLTGAAIGCWLGWQLRAMYGRYRYLRGRPLYRCPLCGTEDGNPDISECKKCA